MSYLPNELSITSDIGVNSDTAISGGNWSVNTYTGAGELNDFAYVGVNLQVDESGTLFFDFSQDGTNWSTYPVNGFTIVSGINEVHTAWKGGRYMRPRFVGVDGSRTFFRLKTYYSNLSLPLSTPLNQSIGDDQDATIVRAISVGQQPDGDYVNEVSDGTLFTSTDTLSASEVFLSSWYDTDGFDSIYLIASTDQESIVEGIEIEYTDDVQGLQTVRKTDKYTYDSTAVNRGNLVLALAGLLDGLRVRYTNGSVGQGSFFIQADARTTQPLYVPLEQSIESDSETQVVRAISVGQQPNGNYINFPADGAGFRSTSAVGDGATFDSSVLDVQDYTQVATSIVADVDGTLRFIFGNSPTMSGTTVGQDGVDRVITVPYTSANGYQYYSAPAFTPYVRYEFTNTAGQGAANQFFFDTRFLTKSVSGQLLRMDAFISPAMVANLGRNVIVGQNNAGRFNNIPIDSNNNLKVRIDEPKTAFGQVSVAEETTIIAQQFPYAINPRVVTTTLASSGTVEHADSQAVLSTGTSANGSAKMVTREVMKYQPGTGSVVRFTAVYTTGITDNTQIVGYGDDTDGFFIGYNGTSFGILRRQDGTDNWTALTAANIDQLDGSGGANNPSNILLDPTKGNVYQIRFQWLGYGAIVFSVEDENTGDFEPFHIIKYANNFEVPSIYAPALPILWETTNTNGVSTDVVLKSASAMAALEGERKFTGPTFTNSETGVTANHVFTIRNDSTNVLGGTNTNRHSIFIKGFSVANDGNTTTTYTLELNTPLTTPSFTKVSNLESIVSVDTAGTLGTAGDLLASFAVAKSQSESSKIFDINDLVELRPGDTLSIRASNTNSTDASITWLEDI